MYNYDFDIIHHEWQSWQCFLFPFSGDRKEPTLRRALSWHEMLFSFEIYKKLPKMRSTTPTRHTPQS